MSTEQGRRKHVSVPLEKYRAFVSLAARARELVDRAHLIIDPNEEGSELIAVCDVATFEQFEETLEEIKTNLSRVPRERVPYEELDGFKVTYAERVLHERLSGGAELRNFAEGPAVRPDWRTRLPGELAWMRHRIAVVNRVAPHGVFEPADSGATTGG